ncbi:MAG: hypothetical protein JSR91_00210 [Proteobacteria bacterium]|nr:hypothetical protein [Pseudomonadota bacterium]
MARAPVALGLQESRSKPLSPSRVINFYLEPAPLGARAPRAADGPLSSVGGTLYGTPGIKPFTSHGDDAGKVRAARQALGYLYVLVDGSLYQEDESGNKTICTGDTIPGSGVAMMTDNGIQLTVLSSGECFVVVGTTISKITSAAYPANGVASIDTLDGYTIFTTDPEAPVAVFGPAITITGITKANPAVVTAPAHGLDDNVQGLIQSVSGMTEVNNREFTIRKIDNDSFSLIGIDSTSYSAYTSGGTIKKVVAQGTGQWFISAQYDSATIDALQFASAESKPDPLLRCITVNREVWLFGSQTIEPWQDSGLSPFPFQRVSGAVMERGAAAALSVATLSGVPLWLGDDLIVYLADGYSPKRVSTFAVEEFIRKAAATHGVADAFAMTYAQGGHSFYVLTLPSADYTFCYDLTTQLWHYRQSGTELTSAVWAVSCLVSWNQNVYAGYKDGRVGILDLDTFDELGNAIRSAARTPPLYNDGKRATNPVLELECELGVGLDVGQGSDPAVMVRWSNDGGNTWANEHQAAIGKQGNRVNRAIVRRTGMFRQRTYEFAISDPVKRAVYGYRFEPIGASS